jgi:cytochrome oxidase assembly protein ShyY1
MVKQAVFLVLWVAVMISGVALGVWQIERLGVKQRLLENIERAYTIPEGRLLMPAELAPPFAEAATFYRGQVGGVIDPRVSFLVAPRRHGTQMGAYLYVSMKTDPGPLVWLNAGFVPSDFVPKDVLPRRVHLMATVRPTTYGGVARPMIISGVKRFAWGAPIGFRQQTLFGDTGQMMPVAYAERDNVLDDPRLLPFDPARPAPANNHFSYALFWLTMSLLAAGFGGYNLAYRRGLRSAAGHI